MHRPRTYSPDPESPASSGTHALPSEPENGTPNHGLGVRSLGICLVLAATVWAFYPTLENDFVNWDDPGNLIDNPHVRGLTAENVRWMFTDWPNSHLGHYQPLTWLSFCIDYEIWGEVSARGIHLSNLVLHCLNVVLFYGLAMALLGRALKARGSRILLGAAFATAVFALHPMRVESVAWATERRDLLSGTFFLLAALSYLKSHSPRGKFRPFWWALSALFHACACLSKVVSVTFLAVVVVLDFYPLRRLGGPGRWWGGAFNRVWLQKTPFFLISLVASAMAPLAQGTAMLSLEYVDMRLRVAYAFHALYFYLLKLLVPMGLSPIYELRRSADPLAMMFVVSAFLVILATALLLLVRRRFPAGLACWLVYVVMLSPVLSITQNGAQFAADRYTYLSCMSWAVLSGGLLVAAITRFRKQKAVRGLIVAACLTACVIWSGLTRQQTRLWHDSFTLWTAALEINSESWVANRNLADALFNADRSEEAVPYYRKAMSIENSFASLYANAAVALAKAGELDAAEHCAQEALRLAPTSLTGLVNAGFVHQQRDEWPEAEECYHLALRHHPDEKWIHKDLGVVLARQSRHDEAVKAFQIALAVHAEDVPVLVACGRSMVAVGDFVGAEEVAHQILRLQPKSKAAIRLLDDVRLLRGRRRARDLAEQLRDQVNGRPDDVALRRQYADALWYAADLEAALPVYRMLFEQNGSDVPLRVRLSEVLRGLDRESEALLILREGLTESPSSVPLRIAVVRCLACSPDPAVRNGEEAIRIAMEVLNAQPDPTPAMFSAAAAAYAEAGRFDEAISYSRRAVDKAEALGRTDVAWAQRDQLRHYRAGKPYRDRRTEDDVDEE